MGIFDDKKYESLDDISKMVEPWSTPLDPILEKLPDQLEVSKEILLSNFSSYDCLQHIMDTTNRILLTKEERSFLEGYGMSYRVWEPVTPDCEEIRVNPLTREVSGSLFLKKAMSSVDQKTIDEMIQNSCQKIRNYNFRSYINIKRTREIVEIISGSKSDFLSKRDAQETLCNCINDFLIKEDRWRIRSVELFSKLIFWIHDYIADGKSACIANIMKVKIRTHTGSAIYSIEEEV